MQFGKALLSPAAVIFFLAPHSFGEVQPKKPDTAVDSVTVLVKNRRVDEITVSYQYQGGGVRRLGRVLPGRDATFRIPWQAAQLKLRVRIIGGGERATNAVTPQPEDLVELWAHGSLNPRSLRIIRATDHRESAASNLNTLCSAMFRTQRCAVATLATQRTSPHF